MSDEAIGMTPLGRLYGALSAAQGEFPTIPKTKTVNVRSDKGSYTFDYAPLDAILAAVRPAMAKHGLAITQAVDTDPNGKPILMTLVVHSGGGMLSSHFPLPSLPTRAQDVGGLLTYYRRYALCAVLSIAADDDTDGDAPGTQGVKDKKGIPDAQSAKNDLKPNADRGRKSSGGKDRAEAAGVVEPKSADDAVAALKHLAIAMNTSGVTYGAANEEAARAMRLSWLSGVFDRKVESSKALTPDEVKRAISEANAWGRMVELGRKSGLSSMEALVETASDRCGHPLTRIQDMTDDEANTFALWLKSNPTRGAA